MHPSDSSVLFSIIIPTFNSSAYVEEAVNSVLSQSLTGNAFEVIVVDDCSTDNTVEVVTKYLIFEHFRLLSTRANVGPGEARNVGIRSAGGQWLIFLDSDDMLCTQALKELSEFINILNGDYIDLIGFNWCENQSDFNGFLYGDGQRRDYRYLECAKETLLKSYLSLQMDGSVIFTAFRKDFAERSRLQFASGVHEDVDWMFFAYWLAQKIRFLNKVLYNKRSRDGSIVNTLSIGHVRGFFRAWHAIGAFLLAGSTWNLYKEAFTKGLLAIVATRVRLLINDKHDRDFMLLCDTIQEEAERIALEFNLDLTVQDQTKYSLIASHFRKTMQCKSKDNANRQNSIKTFTIETLRKSWSCTDLQGSLYVAPDQIRTCCKRFFRNGEIRGDVVLIDLTKEGGDKPELRTILSSKRELHTAINAAADCACDGCPFLEFKEWEPIQELNVRYLSLEYHSVCNLRCSYCSDTYYGGKKASYSVESLIKELIGSGALKNCETVVWGGGEPTIDPMFESLSGTLVEALPNSTHRVLSNSVKYNDQVEKMLGRGQITLVTSVDAGTAKTFELVRGRDSMLKVLENVARYSAINPSKVVIKYIFTEDNSSLREILGFIELIKARNLVVCDFQISSNFKEQQIKAGTAGLMIAMHGLLMEAGAVTIFFDDLLRQRLGDLYLEMNEEIDSWLDDVSMGGKIARSGTYPEVVVWGAGWQAKYLVENSLFFKNTRIAFFVDDTPSLQGGGYLGKRVFSPSILIESDLPIVIAASQSYPVIYRRFRELGIPESRLVSSLIL